MAHDDLQQVTDPRLARADDAHGVDEARVERERIGAAGRGGRRVGRERQSGRSGRGDVAPLVEDVAWFGRRVAALGRGIARR